MRLAVANDGEGNIGTATTSIQGTIVTQMMMLKASDESMQ